MLVYISGWCNFLGGLKIRLRRDGLRALEISGSVAWSGGNGSSQYRGRLWQIFPRLLLCVGEGGRLVGAWILIIEVRVRWTVLHSVRLRGSPDSVGVIASVVISFNGDAVPHNVCRVDVVLQVKFPLVVFLSLRWLLNFGTPIVVAGRPVRGCAVIGKEGS